MTVYLRLYVHQYLYLSLSGCYSALRIAQKRSNVFGRVRLSVCLSASNIEKCCKRAISASIRLLTRCEAKETHFTYL